MESRRPDVIFLVSGAVIVLELKGKSAPSQADIDQAAAYGRDLRCYHRECESRPVHVFIVPTEGQGYMGKDCGVHIAGPDVIDQLVEDLERDRTDPPVSPLAFLAPEAYCPLPTLVQAARELFHSGDVRPIHRARAATDPAVEEITRVIHEAAATRTRRLVLLTGVPGAGKTLVGLRAAHAHFLDDLAVERKGVKPGVPAVFLSGNAPLVEVLQYELRKAGGGGKTFVRGVKDYVKTYSRNTQSVPPEHVLIFDEAQRAFDAEMVQEKHRNTPGFTAGKSEPEHFIEFAERIPEWCVVIGLIGSGQEIHVGEEAGLVQWRHAIEGCKEPERWQVHIPPALTSTFQGAGLGVVAHDGLNLDTAIRFHLASDLHQFVEGLLGGAGPEENKRRAKTMEQQGYHLRITRDLAVAKDYLQERYADNRAARFGLVASAKDKALVDYDVRNDFQSTKRVRFGPWYSDDEDEADGRSCRNLRDCVTEFGAQGLELDASLLAWGTDLIRVDGAWSNAKARGYKPNAHVRDPFQLRINAYRVLLTRGRDGTVVFIPAMQELDETHQYLVESGFRSLDSDTEVASE
jgi:DUF2075 family protein